MEAVDAEHGTAAHDEIGVQLIQSGPGELNDSAESESVELDTFLNDARSFEPCVPCGTCLAAFRNDRVAAIDVDPTGLRPPPCA